MMSIYGSYSYPPTLTGYQQVYSERGRLSVLPDPLHLATNLREQPIPPVFRSRHPRPHRIHIARVAPERLSEDARSRSRVTTVISGKLADSKASAKRFLKSFISAPNPQDPSKPERPLSWVSSRSTDKLGFGRRPTSGVWEGKRRSTPETMRPNLRHSIAGPIGGVISSPSFSEDQRSPSPMNNGSTLDLTQRIPEEKPLASGNGVSISIALAEPVLFLQGFENGDLQSNRSTAMLRGSLHLKVTKPAKIKSVSLRFRGRATTKWPEGIPPKKQDFEETVQQMNHIWPFFNAQFPQAEHGPMADHVELYKSPTDLQNAKNRSLDILTRSPASSSTNLSTKELKKLSLQANQSRSFGKGDAQPGGPAVAQKGFRTFNPGDYIYNFELPIDSHMPETINVDLGFVKYELEAIVERAGAFKANLMGTKEVVVIRTPAEGSLEQVEPIAISRNWEDQMHYDIVISGKSFPLGAQVPIAFKLTPLTKVQCHRIKVFITENVEYYCHNKRVHRMEPTRKVQLFEKRADGSVTSTFPGSTMRIVSGGGVPYDLRAAAARGEEIPPPDPTNLLGNLDGDRNIGPTEMEFNVQLPSCINMKDKDKNLRLHFDTTYSNIQVHHWIKVVMRLSRLDAADPTKRRHFEISIDSPFHILSCRATQANISLPAYSSPESASSSAGLYECGCPGAPVRRNTPTSYVPTLNNLNTSRPHASSTASTTSTASDASTESASTATDDDADPRRPLPRVETAGLQRPAAAHTQGPFAQARPMHIIRTPSFLPPSFDSDDPPPPLETPPPQYADIASPTSGLADYFARLADRYEIEYNEGAGSDDDGRATPTGRTRVEIPLTPGSTRSNRSMDIPRDWAPIVTGIATEGIVGRRESSAAQV